MFGFIRRPTTPSRDFNPKSGQDALRKLSVDRLNALYAKAFQCQWPNVMRMVKAELDRRSV